MTRIPLLTRIPLALGFPDSDMPTHALHLRYDRPAPEPGFRLTGRNDGPEGIGAIHDGPKIFLGQSYCQLLLAAGSSADFWVDAASPRIFFFYFFSKNKLYDLRDLL